MKFQDNQGVVQFRNGSNETVQMRKDKAVGILDLRSIGYFKVGYQKMVNMAESSKTFKMYHYKQIKCECCGMLAFLIHFCCYLKDVFVFLALFSHSQKCFVLEKIVNGNGHSVPDSYS